MLKFIGLIVVIIIVVSLLAKLIWPALIVAVLYALYRLLK